MSAVVRRVLSVFSMQRISLIYSSCVAADVTQDYNVQQRRDSNAEYARFIVDENRPVAHAGMLSLGLGLVTR